MISGTMSNTHVFALLLLAMGTSSVTARISSRDVLSGLPVVSTVMSDVGRGLEGSYVDETHQFIPVSCKLAASYGTLTKESMKLMDDNLKIMIVATLRELGRLQSSRGSDVSWADVKALFDNNVFIEQIPGSEVFNIDSFHRNEDNFFKFNGDAEPEKARAVMEWFYNNLLTDHDVRADLQIDLESFANIVAQTGATIVNFKTFFAKREVQRKTVVEIGVIRFPDIDHPYLKVYRLKLVAWRDSRRVLFAQMDRNGIEGEFNMIKYRPRESIMSGIRQEIRNRAIEEAESLFD